MSHRLEHLLVRPARLQRLLVEVARRCALALDERLHEAQQDRLALVAGVELPRQRDLVEAEAGVAGGALKGGERVLAALMLGHGQRDALLRGVRQAAVAQLRAEPRIRAQHRRRAGEHADEVGQLTASSERALQDRDAALRSG